MRIRAGRSHRWARQSSSDPFPDPTERLGDYLVEDQLNTKDCMGYSIQIAKKLHRSGKYLEFAWKSVLRTQDLSHQPEANPVSPPRHRSESRLDGPVHQNAPSN